MQKFLFMDELKSPEEVRVDAESPAVAMIAVAGIDREGVVPERSAIAGPFEASLTAGILAGITAFHFCLVPVIGLIGLLVRGAVPLVDGVSQFDVPVTANREIGILVRGK